MIDRSLLSMYCEHIAVQSSIIAGSVNLFVVLLLLHLSLKLLEKNIAHLD